MKQYFLGKLGRSFGPYTEAEIASFRESGEISKYTWLWDTAAETWVPLDPAPPAPSIEKKQSAFRHDSTLPLEVIAHDGIQAISGKIRLISENGCELISLTPSATPPFRLPSSISLSLLDPDSGASVNLKVQLDGARRHERSWIYSLKWKAIPELILKQWGAH